MGYARYVGRVGGLAVALGVGIAVVTTPGVAWAGPSDSGPSGSSGSSSGSASGSDAQKPPSSGPPESAQSSTASGGDDAGPSADGGDSATGDEESKGSDTSKTGTKTTAAAVKDSAAGDEESKGSDTSKTGTKTTAAAVKDKKSGSDVSATAVTPKKPKRSVTRAPSDTDVNRGGPVADRTPEIKPKSEPVAASTVNEASVVRLAPQPASLSVSKTEAKLDTPRVESAPEPVVTRLSSTVLSAMGLAPSADGDVPQPRGDSPLTLAGLAAFRRQTQQALTGDQELAKTATQPSQSSLMLAADEGSGAVMALAAAVNAAPSASPSQSAPDQLTGAISGLVNGSDVDPGTTLSYAVTGTAPTSGAVSLNSATGSFTYTPTQAARLAAGATTGVDFDGFTVSVSDGQAATPVTVQVAVLPAVLSAPSTAAQTGTNPMGVAVSATKTYVANQASNTVSVIDRANPTATPVTINVGSAPRAIALSSEGTRAYVAGNGRVSVINTATNQVIATVTTVAGDSYGIAVGPTVNGQHRVYVTNLANNTVRVINANTTTNSYTAGASVTVGSMPGGIALNSDGSRAYVANWNARTVSVLNTSTATPTLVGSPITVGTNPFGVAVNADASRVYVSNHGSGSVSVLNPTAATPLVATIGVGANPFGITISPDRSVLYVANGMDTVSMINTKTNTVFRTVSIDSPAENQWHAVAVSPDGRQIYVSDMAERAVRILTINRGNTAPITGTYTVETAANGAVSGELGFRDTDGDGLSYSVVQPSNGTVTLTTAGGYTYTPTQAARDAAAQTPQVDMATFTVTATDTHIPSASTPLSVSVPIAPTPVGNRAPVAGTPSVGTPDQVSGAVSGSLNFTDPDNNPMTYSVPTQPASGTVTLDGSTYTFTPNQAARDGAATGGATSASITVVASDGQLSAPVTFSVPVIPPVDPTNHAPVVTPTLFSQDPLTGVVTGTVRVTDADGDPLGYTVVGTPTHGSLIFNVYGGDYTYTPSHAARVAADQTAGPDTDAFTVSVSDGKTTTTKVVTVPLSSAKLTLDPSPIPVGAGVGGIAFRGSYALVANPTTGNVTVIDTTTNSIVATVPAGAGATSVATTYNGNGTLAFVTLKNENAVSVINTYSNTGYKYIPVGAQPWGVAQATKDAMWQPQSWSRAVYVTNSGSNTVSVIETLNYTVVASIPVGSNPMGVGVGPDGTRAYVANHSSNTVSVIDGRNVVATVPVGSNPVGVAVNSAGTRVYVSHLNGTVSVLNTSTPVPTVMATVPVGPQPYSLALSPDGTLYVANSNDTMSVIDTGTNTVVRTISTDTTAETGMHFVALDPYGRVYVTDAADGVVRSVSGSPSAPTAVPITSTAITVGSNPSLVTVSGNRTYVLNSGGNTISVIDSGTKQVINTVPTRAGAIALTATPTGDRVYVAYYDTVSVIDTATRLVKVDVPIPDLCAGACFGSTVGLTDLAISPDGDRVYIIQEYFTDIGPWASVAVIDTSEDTLIYNEFSAYVTDLEFTADGSRLFYTQGDYRYVHVSDFATGQTPVITVSTPEGGWAVPLAIGIRPDGLRAYVVMDADLFDYGGPAKYVAVIDTDRNSATYNTQIGHIAVPYGARDVAISPDSRRLYVTLGDGKTVEVIDTATNSVLGYFTRPGAGSMAVGPDGTLYFTDYASGKTHAVTVGNLNV